METSGITRQLDSTRGWVPVRRRKLVAPNVLTNPWARASAPDRANLYLPLNKIKGCCWE
jgi:hypothetical protein